MNRSNPPLRLRVVDICIVVALTPVWLPVLLACASAVLVGSGRPILFRQTRAGLHGRPFSMLKFRSMRTGPNDLVPDPSAITPVGRFLRRYSLDELPQLINVLRGEMSLVGPRPMLPAQAERLEPMERRRHQVRPGLTGLAQINGRNSLSWSERLRHDQAWAASASLRRYAAVLLATGGVVLSGAGVDGHDPGDPFVDLSEDPIDLRRVTPGQALSRRTP